jgi:hypothetical protein
MPTDPVSHERIARLRLILGFPLVAFALLVLFWVADLNWLHWLSPQPALAVPEITRRIPVTEASPAPRPPLIPTVTNVEAPAIPVRRVGRERVAEVVTIPAPPVIPVESRSPNTGAPPRSSAATPTTVEAGIFGHITLTGAPPPEIVITNSIMDPFCGRLLTAPLITRFYRVDPNGGLAEVVVSIRYVHSGSRFPVPRDALLLDQIHCEYQPYVFGIQTGQTLIIRNSDPLMHNVHFIPVNNKEFNKAQVAPGDFSVNFPVPEYFARFKCDVHPWMLAYASIFDHPYFSISAGDGTYAMLKPPRGNYVIDARHRKLGIKSQAIQFDGFTPVELDFNFNASLDTAGKTQ